MKKKIPLIVLLVLVASRIFAGEYDCYEDWFDAGNVSLYAKAYFPKGYDSTEANKRLRVLLFATVLAKQNFESTGVVLSGLWNVTDIHLSNGVRYLIYFVYNYDSLGNRGTVWVTKFPEWVNEFPEGKKIYDVEDSSSYSTLNKLYQEQCNKYLKMF